MALDDLLEVTVTVRTKSWSNVRGVRTPTDTAATLAASVQGMSADRINLHGMDASEAGFTVYFDMADLDAACPSGVQVGDVITWGSRHLQVLGKANDEGGAGVVASVDCKELS